MDKREEFHQRYCEQLHNWRRSHQDCFGYILKPVMLLIHIYLLCSFYHLSIVLLHFFFKLYVYVSLTDS